MAISELAGAAEGGTATLSPPLLVRIRPVRIEGAEFAGTRLSMANSIHDQCRVHDPVSSMQDYCVTPERELHTAY